MSSSNKKGTKKFRGGANFSPASFPQGEPWGSAPQQLPCVMGDCRDFGNHYKYNTDVVPTPESTDNIVQAAGKKARKRPKSVRRKKAIGKKSRKGKKPKGKSLRRGKSARRGKSRKPKSRGKTRKDRKRQKGGNRDSVLQPFRNLFRNVAFGGSELVNNWQGRPTPYSLDPNSTSQPLNGTGPLTHEFINMNEIGASADQAAASI